MALCRWFKARLPVLVITQRCTTTRTRYPAQLRTEAHYSKWLSRNTGKRKYDFCLNAVMLTLLVKVCLWHSLNFYKIISAVPKLYSLGLGYPFAQVWKKDKTVIKGNGQHLGRSNLNSWSWNLCFSRDKQEANRLISIFKYSFRRREFLAGAEDVFITSNRVSYCLVPVRLEHCLKVTFFVSVWVSEMSLKRELQLTASPENLKEADDMKEGFLVLGFFFCLVCFGFFVNYPTPPQKKKSLHDSPRKGLRGKEPENCWNTYSEERQTE